MKTLILVILVYAAVYSQVQITDMAGVNCTNFTSLPFPNIHGYYAFEAAGTSGSDIYIGKYNSALNTFTTLQKITYNETENKYPNLFMKDDTLYIVYQSLVNNNIRLVYRTFINNTISPLKVISGTLTNYSAKPKLMLHEIPFDQDSVFVYFETGNSVYLKNVLSDDPPVEIFAGDMDVQYSSPSFIKKMDGSIYAAARWKGFMAPGYYISIKKKIGNEWGWGQTLFSSKEFNNVRFVKVDYNAMLSWDTGDSTRKDIYIMPALDDTNSVLKLRDNYLYSNFDFHADQNYIVTGNDDMPVMYSNAFKIMMGNLLYIRVNKEDEVFNSTDSLIFTSITNTSLYVGSLGMSTEGAVFYTVWEANSDNTRQLFGRRSIEHVTGINDRESKYDFTLKQNYPNPFNPTTKIKWIMNTGSNVNVTVYNMLGKEVQVLLNEYRQPGVHEINFNASGLSSGVYFYKITAGSFNSVKKMVYLK